MSLFGGREEIEVKSAENEAKEISGFDGIGVERIGCSGE
ncbi:hypothetical protein VIA_000442 [Vibrio orientalis CIP 102891 = ATCC 33934]|uniref:Uncharacterized protein n=1 Tax=Vibrio orientalis CIP 102891 = ATCC 33934 TaxID=675816 RepID=A0ABP2H7V9_VIBOR|nr:hypothetical protein VIA_000442 [Vibrio orientalis CIP 102891 = ATCC 33934]